MGLQTGIPLLRECPQESYRQRQNKVASKSFHRTGCSVDRVKVLVLLPAVPGDVLKLVFVLDKIDQPIADIYKIVHYPTLFLVDRQGMIAENENTLYQGLDKKITEYLRQK